MPFRRILVVASVFVSLGLSASSASAVTRCDVMAHAKQWIDAGVMYSQGPYGGYCKGDYYCDPNAGGQCYRPDCSGFVSAVWGLPAPGHVTYSFAGGPWDDGVSYIIPASDLQPGDALNYPGDPNAGTGHIMLFGGWLDTNGKLWAYQENECGTAANYTERNWGSMSSSYVAIRFTGIEECAPASCDRSAGPFTFSCDGEQPGELCVNLLEPEDPDTWEDNYFCSTIDVGLKWSHSGSIAGMECTQINEPADREAAAWDDNYLCVADQSPYKLSYSGAGAIEGKTCLQLNEIAETDQFWGDNYLCIDPVMTFTAGSFSFSGAGPIDGKTCVVVDEPSDPDTWNDNYFCSDSDIGMQWSYAGPIDGMDCTSIAEGADAEAAAWTDNYLCLPEGSGYHFSWSSAGKVDGMSCVRWFDHTEPASSTWGDNWLCVEEPAPPPPPGSGGTGSTNGAGQTTRELNDTEDGCTISSRANSPTPALLLALAALGWIRRRRWGGSRV